MTDSRAVYFERRDCAGVFRRSAVVLLDALVLLGLHELIWWLAHHPATEAWLGYRGGYTVFLLTTGLYLVEVKRRFGTLGNLLTDTRVISLSGGRPSLFQQLIRTAFWTLGPVLIAIDLLWITGDDARQALRDKCAGTYVVRRGAPVAGTGTLSPLVCHAFGLTWCFQAVLPPTPPPRGPPA
ncbi:MAG: hypothetical protein EA425_17115, partial [Puniceicoccaceae bacterium]